jgi:hypothetical protein
VRLQPLGHLSGEGLPRGSFETKTPLTADKNSYRNYDQTSCNLILSVAHATGNFAACAQDPDQPRSLEDRMTGLQPAHPDHNQLLLFSLVQLLRQVVLDAHLFYCVQLAF